MSLLTTLFRPIPLFTLSILLRLALLFYGTWQDSHSPVKYTDIDYLVFTDAARFTHQGRSPYDRETYRYTPLLAWLLLPTTRWFSFGKVVFATADLLAGFFLVRTLLLRGLSLEKSLRYAAIWLLNPMVATISTRGSSEGLLGALVAGLLWAALERRVVVAALVLGLGVHFKIYPFIYAPAIVWWMDDDNMGRPRRRSPENVSVLKAVMTFFTPERVKLILLSFSTFMALNVFMYSMYGSPFIVHTFLHHVTRIDHRHNFSPYNILLYLNSAKIGPPSLGIESIAFIPQLFLSSIIMPLVLAKRDLASCMMAQTFAFVTFNKVCTSQYFLWYMIFLPVCLPSSSFVQNPILGATALALWVLSQAAWLQQAFQLEFLGINTFLPGLWAASMAFFLVNCWILGIMIRDVGVGRPGGVRSSTKH